MIRFYAIVYMRNGEIHLKPFTTYAAAERCVANTKAEFGDKVEFGKVITKDTLRSSFCEHWVH